MAEVASKKSINVVSSKKSEVCSVQSNNGVIQLDNINASNKQLISLCDNNDDEDDLILTNNTRNELGTDDKSLQELIESELALRICSSTEEETGIEPEEQEQMSNEPETVKRIVLDRPQQDDPLDVNTEFIAAETEHSASIEEPYSYQNGYVSPETKIAESSCEETAKPEQAFEQTEVGSGTVIEESETTTHEIDRAIDSSEDGKCPRREDLEDPCPDFPDLCPVAERLPVVTDVNQELFIREPEEGSTPVIYVEKYREEVQETTPIGEEADVEKIEAAPMEVCSLRKKDTWIEQECQQTSQDNRELCQEVFTAEATLTKETSLGNSETIEPIESVIDTECCIEPEVDEIKDLSVNDLPEVNDKSNESATEKIAEDLSGKPEEPEEEAAAAARVTPTEGTLSHSDSSPDAASTQEFLDIERRILNEENYEENCEPKEDFQAREEKSEEMSNLAEEDEKEEEAKEEANDNVDEQNVITESSSELSVSEPTFIEKTEVMISESSVKIISETHCLENDDAEPENDQEQIENRESLARAPLATPDDEISDVSNACDSESREEITTSTTVTSSTTKGGTKTKKKKIEGVTGNDASPNLTPRTKKTKKSKKNELEKENISVNSNLRETSMHPGPRKAKSESLDLSDESDLSNVNVKSLTQNYVSEATRNEQDRCIKEKIATGVSIKQLCRSFGDISNMSDGDQTTYGKTNHTMEAEEKARSLGDLRVCEKGYSKFTRDALVFTGVSVKALRASYCSLANLTSEGKDTDRPRFEKSSFNKFDALSKKTVLHVRSIDAGKVQQQLNAQVGQNGDTNPNCRSCGKVVFQMEQTKAEGLVWHKNCFRCVQCSKQLNVDNYESHESTLYCKPHFKELFQPKPVEESDQPASDKPDLGLEELSSLNVKSRFQVFEKANTETNEIERSPSQIAVKRSPSILSKLAKFQAKGMDIGVADESLNGIPYEESSESEEEEETEETEEVESEIVKAKRATRERPISFTKMDDIKNRWETTSQQGRREVQREARKEEIAGIRSRLFMGKQGKMKEMYQQAVAGSERVTKINAAEEIQHSTLARSIKERFERGEPIAASDDETDSKPKPEKADEEVIAAGISRKSRSLFLELDATAAKTGRPVTPVNPKTPAEGPRRARDMNSPEREIYRDPDVVRAEDRVNEVVHTDTARKMLSIFRQMEENATKKEVPNGPKPLKRFTPPPEDKFAKPSASDSEEGEDEEGEESEGEDSNEERDPNYVRASDKVEDEFLKQAQNAARAKTLCAKFEHWEETDGKQTSSSQHIAEMEIAQNTGDQLSIESASSLRARFESLGSQTNESPRTPKVKVNRFVEIQASCTDVCESCEKKVYPLEKVETNNKIFHKQCFRCLQCNCVLRMDTFTLNNGKLYCIPHFKQLFITRGNYDEGFGVDPHKNKWTTSSSNPTSPSPIAVSNGDL